MRAWLLGISAICVLTNLMAASSCAAETAEDATLLYALSISLKLDDNGILSYSVIKSGTYYDSRRCRSDWCIVEESHPIYGLDSNFPNNSVMYFHDLWFHFIDQYPLVAETLSHILDQFKHVGQRLEVLHKNRRVLLEKYDRYRDESFLFPIEEDIKHLSLLGINLRDATRCFFAAVKPNLIDAEIEKDILRARAEGMRGLTRRQLRRAVAVRTEAVEESLEQAIVAVDQAVAEFERAVTEFERAVTEFERTWPLRPGVPAAAPASASPSPTQSLNGPGHLHRPPENP